MQAPAKIDFKAGQAIATLYVACLTGSGPLTVNVAIGQAAGTSLGELHVPGDGHRHPAGVHVHLPAARGPGGRDRTSP